MANEINIEPHLVPEYTDRGFKHMPPIQGTYSEHWVRLYESSEATEPCLWFRADNGDFKATLHLTLENALRLADQIRFLGANHYQILAELADDQPLLSVEGKDTNHAH